MRTDICVYFHINPVKREVFYVGIGNIKRSKARSFKNRNKWWHNIVNKYGYNIVIIEKNLTWEKACKREKYYIKFFGRKDLGLGILVNMTNGGDGVLGCKLPKSIEQRKKISLALKGKKTGRVPFWKGKRMSEEWIKKRKSRKGIKRPKFSKEWKKHLSESHKGIKMSEEAKKKISESLKGKMPKFIPNNKGRIMNLKTRKNLSIWHKEHPKKRNEKGLFISEERDLIEELKDIKK